MCLEYDMGWEDSRCSISACWIKCVLNKNIGNMKWHIFQKFNKTITKEQHAAFWNNECETIKCDTNVRCYSKRILCNIARVVGIQSWIIILDL